MRAVIRRLERGKLVGEDDIWEVWRCVIEGSGFFNQTEVRGSLRNRDEGY